MSARKRPVPLVLGTAALLLTAGCVQSRPEPLGGGWRIVWETSGIPEAGGTRPHLERWQTWRHVRVQAFAWRSHYLGDDCVLFGKSVDAPVYAACGDLEPLPIAPLIVPRTPGKDDVLRSDPVEVMPGFTVSVAEIKRRAGRQRPRPPAWPEQRNQGATIEAAVAGNAADVAAALARDQAVDTPDLDGRTPLFWAVLWGDPRVVRALLAAGARVDASDGKGETPLFYALRALDRDPSDTELAPRTAVVDELCAAGADPLWKNRDGSTPLALGATLPLPDALSEALARPADSVQRAAATESRRRASATRRLLDLPEHLATPAAVSGLLEEGADPNAPGFEGRTALMTAAKRESADTVLVLLRAGARADARAPGGGTALGTAAWARNLPGVQALLAAGADPNATADSGETPVYWAAFSDCRSCLRALFDAGGNTKVTMRPGVGEPYTLDWEIDQGLSHFSPEVIAMFKERRPR